MEEPTQTVSERSLTITLPRFLAHWDHRVPRSTWRAATLLFAFGFGIGSGIVAVKQSIQWYRDRPLPPLPDRKWPDFDFPVYGFKAKLSTEWQEPSNKLNYKLMLMPSNPSNPEEFFNRFSIAQHDLGMAHVTLSFYDKRHFVAESSDQYLLLFTSVIDKDGKIKRVAARGELYLSRDQYAALSTWDLTVSGLQPASRDPASGAKRSSASRQKSDGTRDSQGRRADDSTANSLRGNDVITGYSVIESNLSTSGGLTFHIYKDAEADKAIEWGIDNAKVHYECSPTGECTLRRGGSGVVLHVRLQK